MLIQQLIGLYLYYIAGNSCIVINLQAVYLPVLQYLHGDIYPADYQLVDYIYYLLLEHFPWWALFLLDPGQGILAAHGGCKGWCRLKLDWFGFIILAAVHGIDIGNGTPQRLLRASLRLLPCLNNLEYIWIQLQRLLHNYKPRYLDHPRQNRRIALGVVSAEFPMS